MNIDEYVEPALRLTAQKTLCYAGALFSVYVPNIGMDIACKLWFEPRLAGYYGGHYVKMSNWECLLPMFVLAVAFSCATLLYMVSVYCLTYTSKEQYQEKIARIFQVVFSAFTLDIAVEGVGWAWRSVIHAKSLADEACMLVAVVILSLFIAVCLYNLLALSVRNICLSVLSEVRRFAQMWKHR